MTNQLPTIDEILKQFFSAQLTGKTGLTRHRIEVVEERLRACAEAEAERILVTQDLLLLAAEREFDPAGAVARVMHAEDLIFILSIFATAPWLPDDPVQCRKQLQLTDALTGHVLARGLVNQQGLICPLLDIRARIDKGKWELRRAAQVSRTGAAR
jgi:hypothetical protein